MRKGSNGHATFQAKWLLLLAVLFLLAALYLWNQSAADDSLRRVQESGLLRVGLEASFPPFETTDGQGNYSGFDVDLANALARELGVRARFDNLSYDTLYDALAARRVDVLISSIIPEPERTQEVAYSAPYFDGGLLLVVRQGEGWEGVGVVAVEAGSAAEEEGRRLAAGLGGMSLAAYSEPGLVLAALARGETAAAISDPVSLAEFRRAGGRLTAVGPRLTSEPYVVATRRQDRTLAREIEGIMGRLQSSGELDGMVARWF